MYSVGGNDAIVVEHQAVLYLSESCEGRDCDRMAADSSLVLCSAMLWPRGRLHRIPFIGARCKHRQGMRIVQGISWNEHNGNSEEWPR